MKLIPQGDRVILKAIKEEEKKTESGLIVPVGPAPLKRGLVFAAGIKSERREGEIVLYEAGAGTPVEDEGVVYIILREADIACVLPSPQN